MIAGLSDLLRRALESADEQEVPLREEIKFVETLSGHSEGALFRSAACAYGARRETLDAQVPNLILQPLVENAIRHGISLNDSAGLVVITS